MRYLPFGCQVHQTHCSQQRECEAGRVPTEVSQIGNLGEMHVYRVDTENTR